MKISDLKRPLNEIASQDSIITGVHKYFHPPSNLPYFPKKDNPDYIDPTNGYHFFFDNERGTMVLASTANAVYSAKVITGRIMRDIPWNIIEGKVEFPNKLITFAKESFSIGTSSRTRSKTISNIKALKQTLKILMNNGVTEDFLVKGLAAPTGKQANTVGKILALKDPTEQVLQKKIADMKWYHGTTYERAKQILKVGLRPGLHGNKTYVDRIEGYSDNNVYLSSQPNTAMFYAKRQMKNDDTSNWVILEISDIDPNKIRADDAFPAGGDQTTGTKMGLRLTDSIAYFGIILPKKIRVFKTNVKKVKEMSSGGAVGGGAIASTSGGLGNVAATVKKQKKKKLRNGQHVLQSRDSKQDRS